MILKLDFVSSLQQILKLNVVIIYIIIIIIYMWKKATKFVWCLKSNNYHIYKDPENKYKAKKKRTQLDFWTPERKKSQPWVISKLTVK